MSSRSSSNLIVESVTISKRRNHRRSKKIVEPEFRTIVETPVTTIEDAHTMSELLQAPTEGYGDKIVILAILADNFKLKVGVAQIWLEKEPSHSILTWEDLISKFFNHFFPPSKTTNLKNDITNFQQRFDESFGEAWDRFKDLLCKCPHHGFSEFHQIDTFYNALTQSDQDSLNATAGGNLLNRSPRDALTIIENKSKARILRNKMIVSKNNQNYNQNRYNQNQGNYQAPNNQGFNQPKGNNFNQGNNNYQAPNNQTQVGPSNDFLNYMKTNDVNMRAMQNQIIPSNTVANLRGDMKDITTQSGVVYEGPLIPPTSSLPKEVEREPKAMVKEKQENDKSEQNRTKTGSVEEPGNVKV
nr:reverse transcriptase domain-containing protein [Tanacetum cinerariifolium]